MSQRWVAKAPADIAERLWVPKQGHAVSSASFVLSAGTVTFTQTWAGDEVTVMITGGAAGVMQIIIGTAILDNGETVTATIYLPVAVTTNALAQTGQDIARFALRKITGNEGDYDATEVEDALERLTDMLAAWSGQGADLGVALPVTTSTIFYCPDGHISAVKNNLILQIADLYGQYEPSPVVVANAQRGLQQIKTANLSRDRGRDGYF